jgi:hypothetical protein
MPKRITVEIGGELAKATPRALRLQRTRLAVAKQVKIAKQVNAATAFTLVDKDITQPGRLRKRHATNCGKAGCSTCANPRHNSVSAGATNLTLQEKTFLDIQREGLDEVQLDLDVPDTSTLPS